MTDALKTLSEHRCFGGTQTFHEHDSREVGLPMRFSVFLPPQAASGPVPAVIYLAGLTCNEETFMTKAGAQRLAAELGLALVAPDTSPRGAQLPGESESWDFGVGAGFYLDATEAPWSAHWRMESYLIDELLALLGTRFPIDPQRIGVFGHSMGGHGALTISLRTPGRFRATSAFAPIVSPINCPWGQKALGGYLGDDRSLWQEYDACALIAGGARLPDLLVDQGEADNFLDEQLKTNLLVEACEAAGQKATIRMQPGYDHSYYFISTFMADHLAWHAARLKV